jgi:single-stranded-DNA-specific exonuclease
LGLKYRYWLPKQETTPSTLEALKHNLFQNRHFTPLDSLEYGDYGLIEAYEKISRAIKSGKRIALYADYDVDGTMSCVAWLWFLKACGHTNHTFYIPDRFTEGYGVNLDAIKRLVEIDRADMIITMDTGITANLEAAWCKERGVDFICTDHHKIQPDKMPDSTILNPKLHPDEAYQELCGCGITFVLLRKIGRDLKIDPRIWQDLLALTGIATICDIVPLNPVNHRLARLGVEAARKSQRAVFKSLLEAVQSTEKMDEKDVGFRIGPRINAVGRLEHARIVVEAFLSDDPSQLIKHMGLANDKRKTIQAAIVKEADEKAKVDSHKSILFLGSSDWHQGVVGIAASRIAEDYWRPTWLFQRGSEVCKGSARSIAGFDVTEAMMSCGSLFKKFGGHRAAGGFAFHPSEEHSIKAALEAYGDQLKMADPKIWDSKIEYDCILPWHLADTPLLDILSSLRPFGHGFEEPKFVLEGRLMSVHHYKDKATGEPKHTALTLLGPDRSTRKVMFFNRVVKEFNLGSELRTLVTADRNLWNGQVSIQFLGVDLDC